MAGSQMPIIGEELPLEATPKPMIGEEIPLGDKPEETTMAQKIAKGAGFLPTVGAIGGGILSAAAAPGTMGASLAGGSALVGLGAAAGKAGEQIVKRAVGEEAPETSTEAAKEIFVEGGLTAALNMVGGKILQAVAPAAKSAAKQILRGFARVDENVAGKVLSDPTILTRAKPMEEVKKLFSKFFKDNGFVYGDDSVKAATGRLALPSNTADDFIIDTLGKIEAVSGTTTGKEGATKLIDLPENKEFVRKTIQEALAARYAIRDGIKRAARSGNDSLAARFIKGRNQIDDWLETQIPGFAGVRKQYEEAKIRMAFEPLFPLNKNKETSVLGVMSTIVGTFGAGGIAGPMAAIPVGIASSPKLAGAAIRAAEAIGGRPAGAAASGLAAKGIQSVMSPDEIKSMYKSGKLSKAEAAQMLRDKHGFK